MTLKHAAYCLPINPEPWAVGSPFVKRGGGKSYAAISPNKTLNAYKDAVRAELLARGAEVIEGPYILSFWFWRENVTYTDAGGAKRSRNSPDLSNLVKATEDALQGVLIENDRDTVHIRPYMVACGKDVQPRVVIEVEQTTREGWDLSLTPAALYAIEQEGYRADRQAQAATENNLWTPGT